MTAEIVVMNREAVALAADSAVTIGGGPKILNTANKIFMLAPNHSVGILLYNNPSLMEVPWEILIKEYREFVINNDSTMGDLEDYSNGLLSYVEQNGARFVQPEQEQRYFREMVFYEYGEILKAIWKDIRDIFYKRAEISDDEINNIATETINCFYQDWQKCENILPKVNTEKLQSKMSNKFEKDLAEIRKNGFGNFSLSAESLNQLSDIAVYRFCRRERRPTSLAPFTGIVFAGYGKNNLFPVCVNYEVHGYLCDTLIFLKEDETRVGFSKGQVSSSIIPFAQDDAVRNILDGKLTYYEYCIKKELKGKLKKKEVDTIISTVNREMWNTHTQPIIDTIRILPKDELASVAKTLVNLTSFMRRVSSDLETVGGPVDVGVISKKDGFVWIDRKHYFDIDRNLHFSGNR